MEKLFLPPFPFQFYPVSPPLLPPTSSTFPLFYEHNQAKKDMKEVKRCYQAAYAIKKMALVASVCTPMSLRLADGILLSPLELPLLWIIIDYSLNFSPIYIPAKTSVVNL